MRHLRIVMQPQVRTGDRPSIILKFKCGSVVNFKLLVLRMTVIGVGAIMIVIPRLRMTTMFRSELGTTIYVNGLSKMMLIISRSTVYWKSYAFITLQIFPKMLELSWEHRKSMQSMIYQAALIGTMGSVQISCLFIPANRIFLMKLNWCSTSTGFQLAKVLKANFGQFLARSTIAATSHFSLAFFMDTQNLKM